MCYDPRHAKQILLYMSKQSQKVVPTLENFWYWQHGKVDNYMRVNRAIGLVSPGILAVNSTVLSRLHIGLVKKSQIGEA